MNSKPLFTSDEFIHYRSVLREFFSTLTPFTPTGKRGYPCKGSMMTDHEPDYAAVHKTGKNGNPDRPRMPRTPVLYDRITDKGIY
ncbi:MAG: hypothetical protein LBK03_04440 [Bacteroidales bacterium]|nr:hypothetical protein [Bacteroidales bacterium]